MQSDPIGLLGGANTFGYVSQTPLFNADSFGLRNNSSCKGAICGKREGGLDGAQQMQLVVGLGTVLAAIPTGGGTLVAAALVGGRDIVEATTGTDVVVVVVAELVDGDVVSANAAGLMTDIAVVTLSKVELSKSLLIKGEKLREAVLELALIPLAHVNMINEFGKFGEIIEESKADDCKN